MPYRPGPAHGQVGRGAGSTVVRHQDLPRRPPRRSLLTRPHADEIHWVALPKCFSKVVLCQVHPEKKSVFPFKPNRLEMIWSDHPPNEAAALVEDPGDDALAPGHHLGRGGGVEGGEGLAGPLGADGLAGAGGADGAA